MPRNRLAVNTTDCPVPIDPAGQQIDGKRRDRVDPAEPLVVAALSAGSLLLVTDAEEAGEPDGQPTADQLAAAEAANTTTPPARAGGRPARGAH